MHAEQSLFEKAVPAVSAGDLATVYAAGRKAIENYVGVDSVDQQHVRFAMAVAKESGAFEASQRGPLVMRAVALWSLTITNGYTMHQRGLLDRRSDGYTPTAPLTGAFALVAMRAFTPSSGNIWEGHVKYWGRDLLADVARLGGASDEDDDRTVIVARNR